MPKKRLIFTLLYDSSTQSFVLSRNFRLQRVGNLNWLLNNYQFNLISRHIDELIVLDVSRSNPDFSSYVDALRTLSTSCFIPLTAGGWIRSLDQIRVCLDNGADKIAINSPLYSDMPFVLAASNFLGAQSLLASVDFSWAELHQPVLLSNQASTVVDSEFGALILSLHDIVGEILLNSVTQDGTAQGLDLHILSFLPLGNRLPFILSGGAGTADHIVEAFACSDVEAVSTAHLFNFIGDGLLRVRTNIEQSGIDLPKFIDFNSLSI